MRNLNKWLGIGRLGSDCNTRFFPDGGQICSFSIACGDDYKNKSGEKVERTEWVNCVCSGPLAEIAGKYLHKGSKVFIEGKLSTRKWEKDGVTHYVTEVKVGNMEMLDGKPADSQQQGSRPAPQKNTAPRNNQPSSAPNYDEFDSDDIPFMSLNNMIKSHLI